MGREEMWIFSIEKGCRWVMQRARFCGIILLAMNAVVGTNRDLSRYVMIDF
jgi:hypothetical protein